MRISRCEFQVLLEFLQRPQAVLSRSFLINRLWPVAKKTGERALGVYVYRLNRVLSIDRANGRYIQSVRRQGYRFLGDVKCSVLQLKNEIEFQRVTPRGEGQSRNQT